MPIHFQVGKLPDQTIIAAIEAISKEFGFQKIRYQSGEISFSEDYEKLKAKKVATYILTEGQIWTKDNEFQVRIFRDVEKHNSTYFDEVVITPRADPRPAADALLRLDDVIRRKINIPALNRIGVDNEAAVLGLLEKEMATVASMHEKLLADALELRKTYELQDADRKTQFEQEQREAEKKLREHEKSSLERIAVQKAELDDRIKEFDFSDHMRARRKLREDISTQVQNFLNEPLAPSESRFKFSLIIAVCMAAALGSGFLAYESFESFIANTNLTSPLPVEPAVEAGINQDNSSQPAPTPPKDSQASSGYLLWLLAARGALLSAVAIGFIAYLISLLRNSYERDVQSHRELQRYGMDINRASWVIETAMEMTTKEGAALPEKWVEGAVHGLFQSQVNTGSEVSSLAALGSIMGLAPEVSVGPDGTRVNFSPKATKKAAKETG